VDMGGSNDELSGITTIERASRGGYEILDVLSHW
jgi:hypothetical protein